jgi:flagellar biosynthetic protein FlhB
VAESSSGGEKTEQPTPKRLSQAREDGQIALSHELTVSGMLLVGFLALAWMGPWFCRAMATMMTHAFSDQIHVDLSAADTPRLFGGAVLPAGTWLLAFLAIMLGVGIALCLGQIGLQFSFKPLLPSLARISPLTGFHRLFGLRGLIRSLIGVLKLILVVAVAYHILQVDVPHLAIMREDVAQRLASDMGLIQHLGLVLAVVLLVIALGDLIYQRYQHIRDLMMTKQEIKEEMRQSDGDPKIKGKIRQLQRQMARRRMMQEVPKADVVITNPTHVAVALQYDKTRMAAPIVLAKGYDEVAQRIKAIAAQHGIVAVENVALARALAKEVAIGKPVPATWYVAVAEVLTMVYKLKKKLA